MLTAARADSKAPKGQCGHGKRTSKALAHARGNGTKELLDRELTDPNAGEAVELFCYQTRKYVAAMAAAAGGVDTLVFAGGIGERSAPIRARICAGLEFLGVHVDPARNAAHSPVISPDDGHVTVRVIPTDEETTIARETWATLNGAAHADAQAGRGKS